MHFCRFNARCAKDRPSSTILSGAISFNNSFETDIASSRDKTLAFFLSIFTIALSKFEHNIISALEVDQLVVSGYFSITASNNALVSLTVVESC